MIRKIRQQKSKKNELILSIMYLNVEKENKYIVIIIIKKLSNLIFLLIVLNIKIK